MTKTETRRRIAALLVAAMVAATGAFAASATFAVSDAHAITATSTGNDI